MSSLSESAGFSLIGRPQQAERRAVWPDPVFDESRNADDKIAMRTLMACLGPLTQLRRSFPLPFVTTFLMVALDEGEGVCTYARRAGMHRAVMSRYLRDIGERSRSGAPGLGLVTIKPHPKDPRRRRVVLTVKGRAIAKKIIRQMQTGRQAAPRGDRTAARDAR